MTGKIGTKIVVSRCVSKAQNMSKNAIAAGALPQTPLGELTVLPQTSSWIWGRFVAERGGGRKGGKGTGGTLETAYSQQLFSPQSAPMHYRVIRIFSKHRMRIYSAAFLQSRESMKVINHCINYRLREVNEFQACSASWSWIPITLISLIPVHHLHFHHPSLLFHSRLKT